MKSITIIFLTLNKVAKIKNQQATKGNLINPSLKIDFREFHKVKGNNITTEPHNLRGTLR